MIVLLNFVLKKALPKGAPFLFPMKVVAQLIKFKHYDPKVPNLKVNCDNFNKRTGEQREDEAKLLRAEENELTETANLMRHDAYDRGRGGIRQIRRGT